MIPGASVAFYDKVSLSIFQVTPMTSLKFAELAAKAGFPKGVINILPGAGKLRICYLMDYEHRECMPIH